jgi:hypothetical protein
VWPRFWNLAALGEVSSNRHRPGESAGWHPVVSNGRISLHAVENIFQHGYFTAHAQKSSEAWMIFLGHRLLREKTVYNTRKVQDKTFELMIFIEF